jgi:hypothetical protein
LRQKNADFNLGELREPAAPLIGGWALEAARIMPASFIEIFARMLQSPP